MEHAALLLCGRAARRAGAGAASRRGFRLVAFALAVAVVALTGLAAVSGLLSAKGSVA
jgi:hypothetical protein